MVNTQEARFIRRIDHAEIATSTTLNIDLRSYRNDFGNNFNTLQIINTDTSAAIEVYLDGIKSFFVTANNGSLSFDWEIGINYNMLAIANTSASATIAANAVKISIGRTARDETSNGA